MPLAAKPFLVLSDCTPQIRTLMKALTYRLDRYAPGVAAGTPRFVQLLALLCGLWLSFSLAGCGRPAVSQVRLGSQNIATQQFTVDASTGGVVQGAHGALLVIPAGAFTDSLGNAVTGPVQFLLKEARRDVDILAGGLVTMSGDQILASDGMYMIDARLNGRRLKLNPNAGVYAYLPTDQKQPGMRLYKGDFGADKLDWTLTDAQEKEIPFCDRDKASREKCKRCERLAKMVKKIKPGKKPKSDDYYAKRHVWENGKLYFYSSGSRQALFSQEQLDDCADYLATSANGQALLAEVDKAKAEWKDRIGEYYTYQLKDFGWYNIDRTVPDKVVAFKGRIIDKDGMALDGAQVRLYCKDKDMRVHVSTVAKDGSYSFQFEEGRSVTLYAYLGGMVGKQRIEVRDNGLSVDDLVLVQMDPGTTFHQGFLDELM